LAVIARSGSDEAISLKSGPLPVFICVFCGSITLIYASTEFRWVHFRSGPLQRGTYDREENGTANHANHAKGAGALQAQDDAPDIEAGLPKSSSRQILGFSHSSNVQFLCISYKGLQNRLS
jgi:hypothetical protein